MNSTSDQPMHRHVQPSMPFTASFAAAATVSPPPQQGSKTRPGLPPTPPPAGTHAFGKGSSNTNVSMDGLARAPAGLPPRKVHRRSRSDVPFGYLQPPTAAADLSGAGDVDDLFNAYLGMEGLDGPNSSDERHDDGESRGSSMRNGADSSENESDECGGADSRILLWANTVKNGEGVSRDAAARHVRSLSVDSPHFSTNGAGPAKFSLEFGSGEFTAVEMKRIMADEKLAEMAVADPKRVKRVLANRQSAARSKERKMRYMAELEQKVHILQSEATTLSAQLTLLQRDSAGLVTLNNELKFRLQAMKQQAQLRDALNEALTAEVQRLKLAAAELGDASSPNNLAQQVQLRSQNQMFELQTQRQAEHIPFQQLRQPQQNGGSTNHESKE